MVRKMSAEATDHEFEEVAPPEDPSAKLIEMNDLRMVKLRITAELGQTKMLVREILALTDGSIVELDKMAGELAEIKANDLPLARGEVVVIGDSLHVRIAEIVGANELTDDLMPQE